MINLIPEDIRIGNHYALLNVRLLHWASVLGLTIAAIGLISGLSILSTQRTQDSLQKQVDDQNQKLAAYKPLEAQGQQLSDKITTISNLLDRQVTFSTLLPKIAKIMPQGAILKGLDLSTSDIVQTAPVQPASGSPSGSPSTPAASTTQKPFVILAAVSDRSIAAILLENIKASKDLFSDADIVDITQSTPGSSDTPSVFSRYPYQVTINAYLKKQNPQPATQTSSSQAGPAR